MLLYTVIANLAFVYKSLPISNVLQKKKDICIRFRFREEGETAHTNELAKFAARKILKIESSQIIILFSKLRIATSKNVKRNYKREGKGPPQKTILPNKKHYRTLLFWTITQEHCQFKVILFREYIFITIKLLCFFFLESVEGTFFCQLLCNAICDRNSKIEKKKWFAIE
ncbi:hypothetical protein RFI_13401 [Reticulomyxa filosa]|uniref:Uncharacterized protein n=1 Tax=Reticulomyxa filosa TaxID=46433 RepID=X6NBV2_RETFI|nr:hypothetical protein RFI_13401 [Reticulomyxa filosa]|eukprot:ETO23775.1 hypothetical protein RFI_13401 [Reticulomyxa filosa]